MSSKRWLKEHFDDPYVKQAQQEGYVSRAAFKLLQLQEKDTILRHGMTVVDLGAAPGGWCQVAKKLVGRRGRVIGMDLLPLDAVSGVEFIQGDFTESAVLEQLLAMLDDGADVVLSDMAPNMSGQKSVDQPRSMYLAELALDLAQSTLKPGGSFITKLFHGQGFEEYVRLVKGAFNVVKHRKPDASRARSSEVYLVGMDFKGL